MVNSVLELFKQKLLALAKSKTKKMTDPVFQFRFILWWKYFGPKKLSEAIRTFNATPVLQRILKAPAKPYTRFIFRGFYTKITADFMDDLLTELVNRLCSWKNIGWITIVLDSFPVKSFLNTVKCLKTAPVNFSLIKQFVNNLDLTDILTGMNLSPKKTLAMKTKLIAVLIKETWDLQTWSRFWSTINSKEAIKIKFYLPVTYKSVQAFRNLKVELARYGQPESIEKKLVVAAVLALQKTVQAPLDHRIQTLSDLNGFFHEPHRWRDFGISQYYCSNKNEYDYGRGGLVVVLESLELPIFIDLTPKYKQGTDSILNFLDNLAKRYKDQLKGIRVLGDHEFGIEEIIAKIRAAFAGVPLIPCYGNSKNVSRPSETDKNTRKMVERVIGRLESNWHLEHPRLLGEHYARFHLKMAAFCDLIQVYFNLLSGDHSHPHSFKAIRM